jgi:hypothetical protein
MNINHLLIDRNISRKIFRNSIYLPSSMAEVFVPFLPKFPVFGLMVLHIPVKIEQVQ